MAHRKSSGILPKTRFILPNFDGKRPHVRWPYGASGQRKIDPCGKVLPMAHSAPEVEKWDLEIDGSRVKAQPREMATSSVG